MFSRQHATHESCRKHNFEIYCFPFNLYLFCVLSRSSSLFGSRGLYLEYINCYDGESLGPTGRVGESVIPLQETADFHMI